MINYNIILSDKMGNGLWKCFSAIQILKIKIQNFSGWLDKKNCKSTNLKIDTTIIDGTSVSSRSYEPSTPIEEKVEKMVSSKTGNIAVMQFLSTSWEVYKVISKSLTYVTKLLSLRSKVHWPASSIKYDEENTKVWAIP